MGSALLSISGPGLANLLAVFPLCKHARRGEMIPRTLTQTQALAMFIKSRPAYYKFPTSQRTEMIAHLRIDFLQLNYRRNAYHEIVSITKYLQTIDVQMNNLGR